MAGTRTHAGSTLPSVGRKATRHLRRSWFGVFAFLMVAAWVLASPVGTSTASAAVDSSSLSSSAFRDSCGNLQLFVTTSAGIAHYVESQGGKWTGGQLIAAGSFVSAPVAFQDSAGNLHVFVNSGGGINHYELAAGGSKWGGEVVQPGSFVGAPAAFQDRAGNLHVFVNSGGGINHYELAAGGSKWGGEVVAPGSFVGPPFAFQDPAGNFHVFAKTSRGINHYERAAGGGAWRGEVVPSVSSAPGPLCARKTVQPGSTQPVTPKPVSTKPVTTPLPVPKARRALKVKVFLTWTWRRGVTRLDRIRMGRHPARTRLTIRCLGRRCPHVARTSAVGRRPLRRMLRAWRGRRFHAGARLIVTLTAPGYLPEKAGVRMRFGKVPRVRLL